MLRKHSVAWMGLYCLIWSVYLSVRLLAPPSGTEFLDLILVLEASFLLVPLARIVNRRIRRGREEAFHLAAREEFMRVHASLGDRSLTSFFR